jgi:hypothetical protein
MARGEIFISYRRDDSAGFARAVHDQLALRFPGRRVFMDVEAIEPGLAFDEVIQRAVGECAVLLVMIGRRWLERQADGQPRLFEPTDFVRLEIASALGRDVRVMPVLLDGAAMPSESELPETLKPLARRNAIEISNSRFAADIERLVGAVGKAIGEPVDAVRPVRRPILAWAAGVPLLLGAGGAAWWFLRQQAAPPAADLRQAGWRFCTKCSSLFFDGYQEKGTCPAGGQHNAQGYNFVLRHDAQSAPNEQRDWRFCRKCSAMFFDGAAEKGVCAAGGAHAAEGFNFALNHDVPGPGQPAWRYCRKCAVMFFDGYATKGRCAAGNDHAPAGFDFVLPFA